MDSLTNENVKAFPEKVITQSTLFLRSLNERVDGADLDLNEARANHDVKELMDAIDSCVGALEANFTRGLMGELVSLLGDLGDIENIQSSIGLFNDAVTRSEPLEVSNLSERFERRTKKLKLLVGSILKKVSSKHPAFAVVEAANERLGRTLPSVLAASKLYQAYPDNGPAINLQNQLLQFTKSIQKLQKSLVCHDDIFSADEILLGSGMKIQLSP
jgi:hypothetical protein